MARRRRSTSPQTTDIRNYMGGAAVQSDLPPIPSKISTAYGSPIEADPKPRRRQGNYDLLGVVSDLVNRANAEKKGEKDAEEDGEQLPESPSKPPNSRRVASATSKKTTKEPAKTPKSTGKKRVRMSRQLEEREMSPDPISEPNSIQSPAVLPEPEAAPTRSEPNHEPASPPPASPSPEPEGYAALDFPDLGPGNASDDSESEQSGPEQPESEQPEPQSDPSHPDPDHQTSNEGEVQITPENSSPSQPEQDSAPVQDEPDSPKRTRAESPEEEAAQLPPLKKQRTNPDPFDPTVAHVRWRPTKMPPHTDRTFPPPNVDDVVIPAVRLPGHRYPGLDDSPAGSSTRSQRTFGDVDSIYDGLGVPSSGVNTPSARPASSTPQTVHNPFRSLGPAARHVSPRTKTTPRLQNLDRPLPSFSNDAITLSLRSTPRRIRIPFPSLGAPGSTPARPQHTHSDEDEDDEDDDQDKAMDELRDEVQRMVDRRKLGSPVEEEDVEMSSGSESSISLDESPSQRLSRTGGIRGSRPVERLSRSRSPVGTRRSPGADGQHNERRNRSPPAGSSRRSRSPPGPPEIPTIKVTRGTTRSTSPQDHHPENTAPGRNTARWRHPDLAPAPPRDPFVRSGSSEASASAGLTGTTTARVQPGDPALPNASSSRKSPVSDLPGPSEPATRRPNRRSPLFDMPDNMDDPEPLPRPPRLPGGAGANKPPPKPPAVEEDDGIPRGFFPRRVPVVTKEPPRLPGTAGANQPPPKPPAVEEDDEIPHGFFPRRVPKANKKPETTQPPRPPPQAQPAQPRWWHSLGKLWPTQHQVAAPARNGGGGHRREDGDKWAWVDFLTDELEMILSWFADLLKRILFGFRAWIVMSWAWVVNVISAFFTGLADIGTSLWASFGGLFTALFAGIGDLATWIANILTSPELPKVLTVVLLGGGLAYAIMDLSSRSHTTRSTENEIFPPTAVKPLDPFAIWSGVSAGAYSIGQFITRSMPNPSTWFPATDSAAFVRQMRTLERTADKITNQQNVQNESIDRLRNLVPRIIHKDVDSKGRPRINNMFYYALRDLMEKDEQVLILHKTPSGSFELSDHHYEAVKAKFEKAWNEARSKSEGSTAGASHGAGVTSSEVGRIIDEKLPVSWLNWVSRNQQRVHQALDQAGLTSSVADTVFERVDGKMANLVTREQFLAELREEFDKHRTKIMSEVDEYMKRTGATYLRDLVKAALLEHGVDSLSRERIQSIVDDRTRYILSSSGLQGLSKSKIAHIVEHEIGRGVNYFGLGAGAQIDIHHTSPNLQPRRPRFFGGAFMSAWKTASPPPSVALQPWQDFGDSWCGAKGQTRDNIPLGVSLSVMLAHLVVPEYIVIEHIPAEQSLEPDALPDKMEVWAYIDEETSRKAVDNVSRRFFDNVDPFEVFGEGWVRMGHFRYRPEEGSGGKFVYKVPEVLREAGLQTDHVTLRVISTAGPAGHSCLYRVKMFGERLDKYWYPKEHYSRV